MSAGARGAGDVGGAVCTGGTVCTGGAGGTGGADSAGGKRGAVCTSCTGGAGGTGGTDSAGGNGDAVTRRWIFVLDIHRFSQGVLLDVMFFHALHKNAGDNSF